MTLPLRYPRSSAYRGPGSLVQAPPLQLGEAPLTGAAEAPLYHEGVHRDRGLHHTLTIDSPAIGIKEKGWVLP